MQLVLTATRTIRQLLTSHPGLVGVTCECGADVQAVDLYQHADSAAGASGAVFFASPCGHASVSFTYQQVTPDQLLPHDLEFWLAE